MVRRAWGAGSVHGCLLAICKCEMARRGQETPSPRGCLHSGSRPARVPRLPGSPRALLRSFPWSRGQLCPEQTGLFAHAGISCLLCSFDFLLSFMGASKGAGTPLPVPGSPGLLPMPSPALH